MLVSLHILDEFVNVHLHDGLLGDLVKRDLWTINMLTLDPLSFVIDAKTCKIVDNELRTLLVLRNHQVQDHGLTIVHSFEYDGEVLLGSAVFAQSGNALQGGP